MNFNQIWVWAPLYIVILIFAYMEIMMIYIFRNPEAIEIVQLILHHLFLLVVIYLFFKTLTTKPGTPTYLYTEDDPLAEWRKIQTITMSSLLNVQQMHIKNGQSFFLGKQLYRVEQLQILFLLALLYEALTLIFYFFVYLTKVIKVPPTGQIDTYFIIFTVPLSLVLMIGLFFCLVFHIKLIINNQTNVEYFEKQQEHYDKGLISNCNELLGPGCWLNPI